MAPDSSPDTPLPVCALCGTTLHESGLGLQCPACLLERLISASAEETPAEARPFGDYQLLEELGRGGVGVVYRAWHRKLERTVALKMLLGGPFASPELTARFEREVKMVARLRHPGIVALYEAGEVDGVRFFTMELIEGRTLASMVRDGPVGAIRAASYVRKAAEAVEHAHEHQILHRDLKPSNILIDAHNDAKVADFGLARVWFAGSEVTVNVEAMGSPPYMAPEQVSGAHESVGPPADIYALGAVLYHLLTGRPPHQGSSVEEVLVHVREAPVVAPRLLNPSVPRDIETICLKCLEKDPARRYPSARELAADLLRFERGEPVQARPVGAWGHAWRWSRRNRSLAAALLALAAVLLAGTVAVGWQAVQNRRERERLRLEGYVTNVKEAALAVGDGDYPLARRYLAAVAGPPAAPGDLGFEWRYLWAETAPQSLKSFHPHRTAIEQIAFSRDGSVVATNSLDGTASALDVAKADPAGPALGAGGGWALAYSADGASCYVGQRQPGADSDLVRQVDLRTGATVWSTPGYRVALSRDGTRLAVARGQPLPWVSARGGVEVWDTAAHRMLATLEGDYRGAALSPDGSAVALVPGGNAIEVRRVGDGRPGLHLATGGPQVNVAFSPDGRLVASCGQGEAFLWRAADGVLIAKLPHPWLRVWSVTFSDDGTRLATTCSDRAVRLWDTADGSLLRTLRGHADEVWCAAFSPDGRMLASGGKDGAVLLWPVGPETGPTDIAYHGWARPLFSPDSRTLVLREDGANPAALIVRAGAALRRGPAGWSACGFSADGARLLMWSATRRPFLRWWNVERGEFGAAFVGGEDMGGHLLMQTGVSPDGTRVFQVDRQKTLRVWDAAGGSPLATLALPGSAEAWRSVALSRQGRLFAWSRVDGSDFWIADLARGTVRSLVGHRNEINSVVFSPSGDQLASASSDGSVCLWDTASGRPLVVLPGHPESANDVAFSPDGLTLASLGTFQSLKFWNLATGRELLAIAMPEAGGYLAFSPDGQRLAVTLASLDGSDDRGTRVLQAPPAGAALAAEK